jgi:Protein of unknown function (DUF3040)
MSLSARDRETLSSIEDEFAESDPRLAGLFDEFSRQRAGEKMPAAERDPVGWRRIASAPRRWLRRPVRARHARPSWLLTMLVVSFLLIGTVTAALVVSHLGIGGACPTATPTRALCGLHTPLPR